VPGAVFVVAGDGPERSSLQQRATALGIAAQVIWLGWQESLQDFYGSLDLLLFNSDWDAQARTPLEAMSHGIPVVASILQGGTREVIADDTMGILLSEHDTESLAGHIVAMLLQPDLARSVGSRGRQRVDEYGSPMRHADKVLAALHLGTQ